MSEQMDLEEIEKRADRSTYHDGIWDIYYGLIVFYMIFYFHRPATGYRALNIFLILASFLMAYGLFWAGKK